MVIIRFVAILFKLVRLTDQTIPITIWHRGGRNVERG